MDKILVVLGDVDLQSTAGRVFYMTRFLAQSGFDIDVMTYSKKVYEASEKFFLSTNFNTRIKVMFKNNKLLPMQHTITLVNTFIKLNYDMMIPRSDLRLYKVVAFDDFRGHLVNFTFPDIDITPYKALVLPLMTVETPPMPDGDIFYTTMCFYARQHGVPIIGLNIFPVLQTPPLFWWILDYIVVKEQWERKYLLDYGVDDSKICLLNYAPEVYTIEPIEDKYMNNVLNPPMALSKNELVVTVVNHPRLRFCIKEILQVLGSLDIPYFMFFLKRSFFVRELSEDDVVREFFMDTIKKLKGRSVIVDPERKLGALMCCDVIVSPAHLTTLDFVAKYNKKAVVYNPLTLEEDIDVNLDFIKTKEALRNTFIECFRQKQSLLSFQDILNKATCSAEGLKTAID